MSNTDCNFFDKLSDNFSLVVISLEGNALSQCVDKRTVLFVGWIKSSPMNFFHHNRFEDWADRTDSSPARSSPPKTFQREGRRRSCDRARRGLLVGATADGQARRQRCRSDLGSSRKSRTSADKCRQWTRQQRCCRRRRRRAFRRRRRRSFQRHRNSSDCFFDVSILFSSLTHLESISICYRSFSSCPKRLRLFLLRILT